MTTAADFSPDSATLIAVGMYGPTLWDVATGQIVRAYQGRQLAEPGAPMLAPDGKQALIAYRNGPPVLWNLATGAATRRFTGYSSAFSYNGRYAVLRGDDQAFAVWDLQAEKVIATYRGRSVAASADYRYVAEQTTEHDVTVWEPATGKAVARASEPADAISYSTFSADGRLLLVVLKHGARLIELPSGAMLQRFDVAADRSLWGAGLANDGQHVAALTSDRLILWETSTGREVRTFDQIVPAAFLAFSPDGQRLLFATRQGPTSCDVATGAACTVFRGHRDVVWTLGFSRDGSAVLSGSFDKELKLWNAATGAETATFSGHRYAVQAARLSADGGLVVSTSGDGTTRFWNAATGRELAQLLAFTDGEWVAVTPAGHFNASEGGGRNLSVRVGSRVLAIDQFYERYYDPVFVASALQGRPVEARADLRRGVAAPPEVRIVSPAPGAAFSTETVAVTVSARDNGGGCEDLRLYQNGKALGDEQRGLTAAARGDPLSKTWQVQLTEGVNTFRAVAFSRDRTESRPHELTVTLSAPRKEATLHLLAVGINGYKNPALNLNYAEPDARGLLEFFQARGKGLFKQVIATGLYDAQATKQNIVERLGRLKDTQPQDVVVIYLASHGESLDEEWYLIPHELTFPERPEEVKRSALSSTELAALMKQARAQKVLLLVDACKSGAVLVAFRGFEDRKALSQPLAVGRGPRHRRLGQGPARRRSEDAGARRVHLHAARGPARRSLRRRCGGHRAQADGLRRGAAARAHAAVQAGGPVSRGGLQGDGLPARAGEVGRCALVINSPRVGGRVAVR
jgi:WD40 repeat protein